MKKFIYITLIACLLCNFLHVAAQGRTGEKQKFDRSAYQAKRNAYITAEIGLTANEAAEFIPLDNEFKQKMFESGKDCRRLIRESHSKEKMSGSDYLRLIDCQIDTKLKEAQIEKEYFEKFKQILSPKKLYMYQHADSKFMREFMRESNPGQHRGSTTR